MRPGHGMVQFESALERDCVGFLAGHPGFLVDFESVPDALVTLGFALQTYVEVKYADQAASDCCIVMARLDALRQSTGLPAVLLDERFIRRDGCR